MHIRSGVAGWESECEEGGEIMEMAESWRVRTVKLRFGLGAAAAAEALPAERLLLPAAGVVLITGPSGSGKSTLLGQLARTMRATRLEAIRLPRRALVDCLALPLEETLGLLCRAGLAEARLWLREPRMLSAGEQFRFRLATWMAQKRSRVLLVDEFCNGLDRITACGVAWQLRKFVAPEPRHAGVGRGRGRARLAIVATAHEDLARDLRPALHVRIGG